MLGISSILILAIRLFARILIYALIAEAVLSWIVAANPYSNVARFYDMLCRFTYPIVEPCRRLLSRWNTGMFDWSVFLAIILIQIVQSLLIRLVIILFGTLA